MLARNSDVNGAARSIKQMEDRFNKRFRYPYVFLNEEPFSDQFKECVALPVCLHSFRYTYYPCHSTRLQEDV